MSPADTVLLVNLLNSDTRLVVCNDFANAFDVEINRLADTPEAVSVLFNAVAHVVCLGAKKQMRWIHATRHVALVAEVHARRNLAVCNDPCDAMGFRHRADFPIDYHVADSELAVAIHVDRCFPEPTFAC